MKKGDYFSIIFLVIILLGAVAICINFLVNGG